MSEMREGVADLIDTFHSDENVIVFDGLDDAIVGIVHDDRELESPKVVYSKQKIIQTLISRDKMSYEEAVEFYEFNIAGLYAGKGTPLLMDDPTFAICETTQSTGHPI